MSRAARRAANLEHLLVRHTNAPLCLQLADGRDQPTVAALALQGPAGPVHVRLALPPSDSGGFLANALLLAAVDAGAAWTAVPGTEKVWEAALPLGYVRQALTTVAEDPTVQATIVTRSAGLWLL